MKLILRKRKIYKNMPLGTFILNEAAHACFSLKSFYFWSQISLCSSIHWTQIESCVRELCSTSSMKYVIEIINSNIICEKWGMVVNGFWTWAITLKTMEIHSVIIVIVGSAFILLIDFDVLINMDGKQKTTIHCEHCQIYNWFKLKIEIVN